MPRRHEESPYRSGGNPVTCGMEPPRSSSARAHGCGRGQGHLPRNGAGARSREGAGMAEFDTVIRNAAIATAADIFETIANMSILRRRPDSDRPAMRSRQNLSADHRGDATKLNLC